MWAVQRDFATIKEKLRVVFGRFRVSSVAHVYSLGESLEVYATDVSWPVTFPNYRDIGQRGEKFQNSLTGLDLLLRTKCIEKTAVEDEGKCIQLAPLEALWLYLWGEWISIKELRQWSQGSLSILRTDRSLRGPSNSWPALCSKCAPTTDHLAAGALAQGGPRSVMVIKEDAGCIFCHSKRTPTTAISSCVTNWCRFLYVHLCSTKQTTEEELPMHVQLMDKGWIPLVPLPSNVPIVP